MLVETGFTIINRNNLPFLGDTYEFEGLRYSDTRVSFIWVDMKPGDGVRLHKHPYEEIFIVQEGMAIYTVGSTIIEACAAQIIIVPADTPHKFSNTGDQWLKQIDIHVSPKFITEWLED